MAARTRRSKDDRCRMTILSSIAIEASSFCQLRCPSCPTTSGHTKAVIGGGFLKPQDFCALLDGNPSVREVELSNYGEMFLNPALPEILAAAFSRGVAVTAANGANLNSVRPGALEAIVRYRLRVLNCSIDGPQKKLTASTGSAAASLASLPTFARSIAGRPAHPPHPRAGMAVRHLWPRGRRCRSANGPELSMSCTKLSWDLRHRFAMKT